MAEEPRRDLRLLALLRGSEPSLDALVAAINRDPEYEYTLVPEVARSPAEARGLLDVRPPHVLLLEVNGPTDLDTLAALVPHLGESAVVVLVAPQGLDHAREALRMGAHDYLVTTRLDADRLVRCIRYALVRQGTGLTLEGAAFVDQLTGLYNRRGFLQIADHQIRLSRRKGRGFTLAFADVAQLGAINERHGRAEGDAALKGAAEVLRSSFRDSDVLGRLEGDELIALAIETDDEDESGLRERLESGVAAYNTRSTRPYPLVLRIAVMHEEHDGTAGLDALLAAGRRELDTQPAKPAT